MQEIASTHLNEAKAAFERNDLPSAILHATFALLENPEWPLRGHALHALATIAVEFDRRELATRFYSSLLSESEGKQFHITKLATSYYDAALNDRYIGDYAMATYKYEIALRMFKEQGSEYAANCLRNLAWLHCLQGQVEMAAQRLDEANEITTFDANNEAHYHQLVGEAFLKALTHNEQDALAICAQIIVSNADNTVKAQACYVAAIISNNINEKAKMAHWISEMEAYAAQSARKADLEVDIETLRALLNNQ